MPLLLSWRPGSLLLLGLWIGGLPGLSAGAEAEPETASERAGTAERLARIVKPEWLPGHESLRIGALLTTELDLQVERSEPGENGFAVTDARLSLDADLVGDFAYFLQANLAKSQPLLDLRISYRPREEIGADVGLFKAPFSGEFLIPAARLDLVNRAQIVRALAPGRQIGAQLAGSWNERRLFWAAGLFNGNGATLNDDGRFLTAGRLGSEWPVAVASLPGRLTLAANAAWSEDDAAPLGLDLPSPFAGTRWLAGGDARLDLGSFFAAVELLWGRLDPRDDPAEDVFGYHVTAGVQPISPLQCLVRWDSYRPGSLGRGRDLVVLGVVLTPASLLSLELDYVIPTHASARHHQILATVDVAF
jgi:hypothetical protein